MYFFKYGLFIFYEELLFGLLVKKNLNVKQIFHKYFI